MQIDTIHIQPRDSAKFYIYTLIDLYSRFACAVVTRINTHQSLKFVQEAQRLAPFAFKVIQSDHGVSFLPGLPKLSVQKVWRTCRAHTKKPFR